VCSLAAVNHKSCRKEVVISMNLLTIACQSCFIELCDFVRSGYMLHNAPDVCVGISDSKCDFGRDWEKSLKCGNCVPYCA